MEICTGGSGLGVMPKEKNSILLIYSCRELEKEEVEVKTIFCKEVTLCNMV